MQRAIIAGALAICMAAPLLSQVLAQDGLTQTQQTEPAAAATMDLMDSMAAMGSMSTENPAMAAHMRLTVPWPPNDADGARGQQIVSTLRSLLIKYKDYRVAERDGFQPIITERPLSIYHFTNSRNEALANSSFDPTKPTSLLYSKTAAGYELRGVMYTAPQLATEKQLNARVPLSVARWHAHVNICLPPTAKFATADWSEFGFDGSITTAQACHQAGGRLYPQIYGWMVHVYPFEESPEKIWAH